MLVIVSSSPQMWGSLFISTNIPDLHSIGLAQSSFFRRVSVRAAGLYLDTVVLCLQ